MDEKASKLIANFLILEFGVSPEQAGGIVEFFHKPRKGTDYNLKTQITNDGIESSLSLPLGALNKDEAIQIEILYQASISEMVGTLQHWLPIYRNNRGNRRVRSHHGCQSSLKD